MTFLASRHPVSSRISHMGMGKKNRDHPVAIEEIGGCPGKEGIPFGGATPAFNSTFYFLSRRIITRPLLRALALKLRV